MPRRAALRIAEELVKAKKGNYLRHGWAGYISRHDVEALVMDALEPTERATLRKLLREG